MEKIQDNRETVTVRFSSQEYARLSAIIAEFERKMEHDSVNYEAMLDDRRNVQKFVDDFLAMFEAD